MHDDVIGVSLEWKMLPFPSHPQIERVMQKQVCQQRADYSSNAKDN